MSYLAKVDLNFIKQTNKTILFSEVNNEKVSLSNILTSIDSEVEDIGDETLNEINKELLVESFEEFLQKFDPVIYSYFTTDRRIAYSMEKPAGISENALFTIHLNKNNDCLNMLINLIESRKSSSAKNAEFNYVEFLEKISPKNIVNKAKNLRKDLHYLYDKYSYLDEESPEREVLENKLNENFHEIRKVYNNPTAIIPLAMEDIRKRLNPSLGGESNIRKIEAAVSRFDNDGTLIVEKVNLLPAKSSNENESNTENQLSEIIGYDYEEVSQSSNDYVKGLLVRTFSPMSIENNNEINVEVETQNYNDYLELMKYDKENFINVASPLIQTILGVRQFFEQYDVKEKRMSSKLLITNCSLSLLIDKEEKFNVFLKSTNAKRATENAFWFAIVPEVSIQDKKVEKVSGPFGNAKKKSSDKNNENETKFEELLRFLNIARDNEMQVFFNFISNNRTTFNSIASTGVSIFKDKFEALENKSFSEYAVPCYPNFMVVNENKSKTTIGNKLFFNGESTDVTEEGVTIQIKGIYIGAAYVAAGLVAAYQCPSYLKERFKSKAAPNLPGVRFDIEAKIGMEDNNLKVKTTMPREISGYTEAVINEILDSPGFAFSSDFYVEDEDKVTVLQARNCVKTSNGFEPIYRNTASNYIMKVLRVNTNGDSNKLKAFFTDAPDSPKNQWKQYEAYINGISQTGDQYKFEQENDDFNVILNFNGIPKKLNINIIKK